MSAGLEAAGLGLAAAVVLALGVWVASLVQRDVSLVDRWWSVLIVVPGFVYAWRLDAWRDPRVIAMLAIGVVWAVRLGLYVAWRNWGHGEDRRYQAIRARNEPNFPAKSVYLIFVLQTVLAWLVSLPFLAAAVGASTPWSWLDTIGAALAIVGFAFETVGDQQLAAFKADPKSRGQVMDRGLWRFTRHPNYFGECCVWWGFFGMALAVGGWWSLLSPLVMTGLLLKVSGVALLEQDIGDRRPAYRDYVRRTNAFFPGPRKRGP